MKARPTLLLLPALVAAAACDLKPSLEDGTGMAQEQESSESLTYGGCVRGYAAQKTVDAQGNEVAEVHGRHIVLLRRGDHVRVHMKRLEGDLNPGLALKSPKYSVMVRHDLAQPQSDAVDKTWTVPSTGFYKLVAFPWSHHGSGTYQLDLTCESGPCAANPGLDAEAVGACVGEARDCTLRALGQNPSATADQVPGLFDQCLRAPEMPAVCASACTTEDRENPFCTATIDHLRPFATRGAECASQIENCLADCVPFNTPDEAVGQVSDSPEALCWTNAQRPTCAAFGAGLAACNPSGEGFAPGTQQWCEATCVAREGNADLCSSRCDPQLESAEWCRASCLGNGGNPERCASRCAVETLQDYETPDPVAAEAAE